MPASAPNTRERSTHVDAEAAPGTDRPPIILSDPHPREIHALALRIHGRHPHVSLAAVTALVEQAHADLAGSRVQSFRMILTERAVRRRLTPGPRGG